MISLDQRLRILEAVTASYDKHLVGLTPKERMGVVMFVRTVVTSPIISERSIRAIGKILVDCYDAGVDILGEEEQSTTA